MGMIANYRLYRRVKNAARKSKEIAMLEGIPKLWKRIVLIAAPPIMAYISAACPALFSYTGVVALGGAVLAGVMSGRKSQSVTVSSATGGGAFAVLGLGYLAGKEWIDQTCGTTFLQQLPTLATTALSLGLAAFMKGKSEA